jgi:acyl carrier protein
MDRSELVSEIREMVISELDLRGRLGADLGEDEPLFGGRLGLDSLDALQLATALEERFKLRLPDGDDGRGIFTSVATIAAYVARATQP